MHYTIPSLLALALTLSAPVAATIVDGTATLPSNPDRPTDIAQPAGNLITIYANGANGEADKPGSNHVEIKNPGGRLKELTFKYEESPDGNFKLDSAVESGPTGQRYLPPSEGWPSGGAIFHYVRQGEGPVKCWLTGKPDGIMSPFWSFNIFDSAGGRAPDCAHEVAGVQLWCDGMQQCA